MKKFILLLSLIALFCQSANAQTGGLNFQGVARNSTGAVLANQKINLKFSILKTTETGAVEYTETKEVTTNAQGIFAVVVGEVNASSFAAVDWKASPKFLKVEMDPAGGTSFVAMGTTRLQNVPYAYYANGVNANNIDGTISVEKGGTGATDAVAARTNLGLVIGTNVQAPLTAGTDYLTPSGNAATATKLAVAKKINGVDFDGSSDINITATADANTLSGTVAVAKGGTGASTAVDARANLGLVIGTNVQAPLTAGTDYLTPTGNAASATKLAIAKKINGVDFDGSANIIVAADASTLSGTVAIAKGGTGATDAATARTNLGLVIGTNVQAPLTAGTDYLAPNGSAASLTNFPTLNQNTTGIAASATIAGNITATSNATLTTLSNLNSVGTITSGVWSGTVISIEKGGTGLNVSGASGQVLSSTGSGTLTWTTLSSFVPYTGATRAVDLGAYDLTVNGITVGKGKNNLITTNTVLGNGALANALTSDYNTAIGYNALNVNGANSFGNTAVGANTLTRNTAPRNTAVGESSLQSNVTGESNTALGEYALAQVVSGSNNTGIGNFSLAANIGNQNSALGAGADVSVANISNSTAIGYDAKVATSNTIQLGNNSVTNVKTNGSITAGAGASSIAGSLVVGATSPTGSSAALEVKSTTQGLLLPRLTMTQRNAIVNPTQGLMIFCTTAGPNGQLQVYNGSAWTNFIGETAFKSGKLYNYRSSVLYSFDGSTWANTGIGVPNNGFNGASGSRSYIGTIGSKTYHHDPYTQTSYSFNGTTWTTESSTVPNNGFNGALGSRSFVGVINNKAYHWDPYTQTFYSFDGTTWATVSGGIPNSGFNGAVGSRSLVGVINNKAYHWDPYAQLFYSFDGTTWATIAGGIPNSGFNGAISSRSYVGVINNKAYHYDPYGQLFYSFDGVSWTIENSTVPNFNGSLGTERSYVGELENKVYHYNSYTSTLYSFDGTVWEALNSNTPSSIGGWLTDMGSTSFVGIAW
jgi:hypothetical protein